MEETMTKAHKEKTNQTRREVYVIKYLPHVS